MSTPKTPQPKRRRKGREQQRKRHAAPKPLTDSEIVLVDTLNDIQMTPAHKRRIALRMDGEDKDVVSLRLDSDQARARQAKRWAERFGLDIASVEDKLRRAAVTVTADVQKRQLAAIDAKLRAGVGGAKSPPVTPITLDQARPVYAKWIAGMDPDLLDVVFGTIMAHRLDGDPVWLFLIGPPGDGKTEVVRSMSADEAIYTLSSLKPAALISGFQNDKRH